MITGVEPFAGVRLVSLRAATEAVADRALLVPPDRLTPVATGGGLRRVGVLTLASCLVRAWRAAPAAGADAAHPGRHTHPLAWQLDPVLSFERAGCTRVLLADAVGLGKTIQAGMVIAQVVRTRPGARALVLVPAGLKDQWRGELAGRFALDPVVLDAIGLRRHAAIAPMGLNPWTLGAVSLASIDFLKQPDVLEAAAALVWDLVVVDEAHALAPGTDRLAAADRLARQARRVLLLTATPHAGAAERFAALCRVGALDDEPITLIRRSRADVGVAGTRRVRARRVRLGAAARLLHDELVAYARAVWADGSGGDAARLAMTVLLKRAASSTAALVRSLSARAAALGQAPEAVPWPQLPLPFTADEDEQLDDTVDARALAAPGLAASGEEARWLRRLLALATTCEQRDAKLEYLCRLVRRSRERWLIFTEYRDTLAAAAVRLSALTTVAVLHGGLSARERREAERRFATGAAAVLIATDVASEGLNLQHGSRAVVSLELPWSPARLEQRIGRVDRIGQTRPVHALNLVGDSPIEPRVLAHLAARMDRITAALGDVPDALGGGDLALAATTLGFVTHDPPPPPATRRQHRCAPPHAQGQACADDLVLLRDLAERLEVACRRSTKIGSTPEPAGGRRLRVPLTVVRLRRAPAVHLRGVVVVCRTVDPRAGAPPLVAVHVALAPSARRVAPGRLARSCLGPALDAASAHLADQIARGTRERLTHEAALLARERALARACDAARAPVQEALFPTPRSLRHAAAADAALRRLETHVDESRRLESVAPPEPLVDAVAVLVVR